MLTRGSRATLAEEVIDGVHVHRVPETTTPSDLDAFLAWVDRMNADMVAAGLELAGRRRRRPRPRLAGRRRRRHAGPRRRGAVPDDDPRHRVRAPPGLGGQAPAVPHPRRRALDGAARRPRHHLLALHARPRRRHLRPRRGRDHRDPQRDRPRRPAARRRPRHAARALRRARRAPGPARRPARLREGLPARARRAARPDPPARQRPLPGRRVGHARGPAQGAGRAAWGSPSTARSWAGSATTCCTRSTGSPT